MEKLMQIILLCIASVWLTAIFLAIVVWLDGREIKKMMAGIYVPQYERVLPKPIFKPKEPEETPEQRRERILLENVENYDGTPKGQIKL